MELRENNNSEQNYEQKFTEVTGKNFQTFYKKYFVKLVWHIQKYKITQLDAEDLANEAFIQSLKKIHQYNPEYNYTTWLFTIGNNLARKYKKDNANTFVVDMSSDSNDEAHTTMQNYVNYKMDNSEIILNSENITELKYSETIKEINKLSPKYKDIIVMRDIEGYSYNDICDMFGLTLQTVKNRLHHGRNNIQKKLETKFSKIYEQH